jgi:hypothetical protein
VLVRDSFAPLAEEGLLTFDSELLLNVLEVVGILGADGASGRLDGHFGVV